MITRKLKIERRVVESLLSSVAGGAFVAACIQKSWLLAGVAVVTAVALLITEKADIEEEE